MYKSFSRQNRRRKLRKLLSCSSWPSLLHLHLQPVLSVMLLAAAAISDDGQANLIEQTECSTAAEMPVFVIWILTDV